MYLIADGGATKTDWCLTDNGKIVARIATLGINPFHENDEKIFQILSQELMPKLPEDANISEVFFYGAGCTPEKCGLMEGLLRKYFPKAKTISVLSDLWGAARALCGHKPGIACILGTGSNSCYYDGKTIIQNTPPLGYILGDEGSGAVLGKMLLADILKGILPAHICNAFLTETKMTKEDFLDKVYRQPMPSRFLASLAPFVMNHKDSAPIHNLAVKNFRNFFSRNVAIYKHPELKVNFIGGLAHAFSQELQEAAGLEGFTLGLIQQSPITGLLEFHKKKGLFHLF